MRRRCRRRLARYEDEQGRLAAGAGLDAAEIDTVHNEKGQETTEWRSGGDAAATGAPVWRVDTAWYDLGTRRRVVRQGGDPDRKPLAAGIGGRPSRIEEEYNEPGHLRRRVESGFDETAVGYRSREATFSDTTCEEVTHRRADGTKLDRVDVWITAVAADAQPRARENLRAGDRFVRANDVPIINVYEWAYREFDGGWIEVVRDGQTLRIEGFEAGKLGVDLDSFMAEPTSPSVYLAFGLPFSAFMLFFYSVYFTFVR